jgi:hypothetical protein
MGSHSPQTPDATAAGGFGETTASAAAAAGGFGDTTAAAAAAAAADVGGEHQLVPVPLPVGSVRASLGALSTFADCYALVRFLGTTFKDFQVNDQEVLTGVKMVSCCSYCHCSYIAGDNRVLPRPQKGCSTHTTPSMYL